MPAAPSPSPVDRLREPSRESLRERLRERLSLTYGRIEAARRRSPHAAPRVRLVAVTKGASPEVFDALVALGEHDVGENRVADAASRRAEGPAGLVWHGIGHLQTNKVKKAIAAFDVFHAIDSLPLAQALNAALEAAGRTWPVYAQVNAADDRKKGGVAPSEALAFLAALADLPRLAVIGWMTMAAAPEKGVNAGEAARPCFATLRALRDDAVARGIGRVACAGLSMGMSDDFETAVEEGATLVRVGRTLFSPDAVTVAPSRPARSPGRRGAIARPATGRGPDSQTDLRS